MRSLTSICTRALTRRGAWQLGAAAGSIALAWLMSSGVAALAETQFGQQAVSVSTATRDPSAATPESAVATDYQQMHAAISLAGHASPRKITHPPDQNPLRAAAVTERKEPTAKTTFAAASPAAIRPSPRLATSAAHRAAGTIQPPESVVPPVPAPEIAPPGLRPIPTPGDNIPPGFPYDGSSAGCGACGPQWYAQGEGLYFTRNQSERRVITRNLGFGQFDFEFGGRVTVGRQFDCLEGVEIALTHFSEWSDPEEIFSPAGGLNSRFVAPVFGAASFNDFTNAVRQQIRYDSQLTGFELNQRQFGWDVVSSMWGFRYINLDEQFLLRSQDLAGDVGVYAIDTDNHLVGLQIGGDMAQPVTENLWFRGRTKIGGFANFSDHDSVFFNTQGPTIRNGDDEINFAFLSEVGVGANLQLTPGVALRAGYEFWYIWGLALAPEQFDFTVGPRMGAFHDDNGSMFLHGPTAGLNIVW